MLNVEYLIGTPATIVGLVVCFVASFVEMPIWSRIVLNAFAVVMISAVAFIAVGIEQKAGYYKNRDRIADDSGLTDKKPSRFLQGKVFAFWPARISVSARPISVSQVRMPTRIRIRINAATPIMILSIMATVTGSLSYSRLRSGLFRFSI